MKMNTEWINYPEALARMGGDEKFLSELIELYIADFVIRLQLLNEAIADGNFDQIFYQAHTLKGSSANLSLKGLQELAMRMETAGKEKDPQAAHSVFQEMKREFRNLLNHQDAGGKIRPLGVA